MERRTLIMRQFYYSHTFMRAFYLIFPIDPFKPFEILIFMVLWYYVSFAEETCHIWRDIVINATPIFRESKQFRALELR